jgi:predicted Fe-Mo cluster-binding NifX family protein
MIPFNVEMFVCVPGVGSRSDIVRAYPAGLKFAPIAALPWLKGEDNNTGKETNDTMKIAITSTGNSPDSKLDQRFGRCAFFVIYDTESGAMEYIPNPNRDAQEGAGPASVQLVASRDVKRIVSGEFGVKIKSLLDSLKIQMIVYKESDATISKIIEMIST